ncbi:hypothetical protein K2Z84_21400 [Candidatus Binatia bacterium]|nr:hypothetical protein [Candidatus Binatia bacterium]
MARAIGDATLQTADGRVVHPLEVIDTKVTALIRSQNALALELRQTQRALGVVLALAAGVAEPDQDHAIALVKRLGVELAEKPPGEGASRLYLPSGV